MTKVRFVTCTVLYLITLCFGVMTAARVLAQRDQIVNVEVEKLALKILELKLSLPPGAAPGTPS